MAYAEKRGRKWIGRYRDPNRVLRSTSAVTTEKQALLLAKAEELKIAAGDWLNPSAGNITFAAYFENEWLPNRKGEINSRDTWEAHYNAHLKKAFGSMALNEITSGLVQRWVVRMQHSVSPRTNQPLAPATIHAVYRTLATALGAKRGVSAVRDKLIAKSPCVDIDLPDVDELDIHVYEPEHVEAIMGALDPWWRPLVMLDSETGLRWGELLGLEVSDFTHDYHQLTVNRTIVQTSRAHAAQLGYPTRFVPKHKPKNKRRRKVSLSDDAAEAIKLMIRERRLFPRDRLFAMPDTGRTGPRRTEHWPTGQPISRSWFRGYVWMRALQGLTCEIGGETVPVPVLKVHALRATHITWLLAGGADLKTVMDRVGHRELATVQRYYAAMQDAERLALDALAITKNRRKHSVVAETS